MAHGKSLELAKIQPKTRRRVRAVSKRQHGPTPTWPNRNRPKNPSPRRGPAKYGMQRLRIKRNGAVVMDPWQWSATHVPAPKRKVRNKRRNQLARASRKVNR